MAETVKPFAIYSAPVAHAFWVVTPSQHSEEAVVMLDLGGGEGPVMARCTYFPAGTWAKDAHTAWESGGRQLDDGPPRWLPEDVRAEATQMAVALCQAGDERHVH